MKVSELRSEMAELAEGLDARLLTVPDAKAALDDMTAIRNIASTLVGSLGRRVAKGAEWERAGFASEEQWLASVTGSSPGTAKDALETARRLEEQDDVADAANRGELSPEQANAIADACEADPAAQQKLLEAAKTKPLGKLRDDCARTKQAADPDPDATHDRVKAERRLRFGRALDGAVQMMGANTPEEIAVIKAAVEKRGNELFDQARREGRHEPREAYLMDALVAICRDWLNGIRPADTSAVSDADSDRDAAESEPADNGPADNGPADFGEDTDAAVPEPRTPKAPNRPAWLGLLRIDLEALLRGAPEGDELCEITGVGPIPVSVARRLLGESVLKLVITRGVDVANVTHLGRGPTVAQKMALLWSSPGCCVTGCARMAGIEHDHTRDWTETRHTVLGELRRVCEHHHDLKTLQGWDFIELTDHSILCVSPDDPRHPKHAPAGPRAGPEPASETTLFNDAA